MPTCRTLTTLSAAGLLACSGDTDGPEPAPNVATMRLVVGAQAMLIASNGSVTAGPLLVDAGDTVQAQFFLANGEPDPAAMDAAYTLRITPAAGNPAGLTLTPMAKNRFAAIVGAATASVIPINVQVGLVRTAGGADPFGPFVVPMVVP